MSLLSKKLNGKRIAYYKMYADVTGKVTAGVMLSQIMFWLEGENNAYTNKIWKIDREIIDETGLTTGELRSAKKLIGNLPFIRITKEGVPAKTFYYIDWRKYNSYMEEFLKRQVEDAKNKKVTNKNVKINKTDNDGVGHDSPQFSEFNETSIVKNDNLYTKSTAKNTKNFTNVKCKSQAPCNDLSPAELDHNGLYCKKCLEPQFKTRSGDTCINGHGGEEGIEKKKDVKIRKVPESRFKKIKKIPLKKKLPNLHNYSDDVMKILTHWDKCGGKLHTGRAKAGPDKIKTHVETLLIDGALNPYSEAVKKQETIKRGWSVDEIIASIDSCAVTYNNSIKKMTFDKFVYNEYATARNPDKSLLVKFFIKATDPKIKEYADGIKTDIIKEFYRHREDIEKNIPDGTFVNIGKHLVNLENKYVFTNYGPSLVSQFPKAFSSWASHQMEKKGKWSELKYLSGEIHINSFVNSLLDSHKIRKKTKDDIAKEIQYIKDTPKREAQKKKNIEKGKRKAKEFREATKGMNKLEIERYKIENGLE